MSAMVLAISYFYIINTQDSFEKEREEYNQGYYKEIKVNLKNKINLIIDILEHNHSSLKFEDDELKKYAVNFINSLTFEQNKSNYIFVYEIKNIQGGDKFAKMLVNPNRPELIGKYLSTDYEDSDGNKFREKFLADIRKSGESYIKYSYKKPSSSEAIYKLSYFKYYERFDWVIAVGVYIDDIEKKLEIKKAELEKKIKEQIIQNIIFFAMFLSIAIFISMIISNKIYKILKDYKNKVKENEKELKILNKSLEEMISNIAHQWRQPLAELSSILMLIRLKYEKNTLDKASIDKKVKEASKILEYMSSTIDDFRSFFLPTKEKEDFYLYELVENTLVLFSRTFEESNISLEVNIDKNIVLRSYLNEYQQIVLNILKNAKDSLIESQVKDALIKVSSQSEENFIILNIEDNGKGILVEPISKIFEAYFTTKNKDKGLGIGLYMSKMIVEKSMKGRIEAYNTSKGAKFRIITPKN